MKRVGQGVILVCGIVIAMVMSWHYQQQIASVTADYERQEKAQVNHIKAAIERELAVIDLHVAEVSQQLIRQIERDNRLELADIIQQAGNNETLLRIIDEAKEAILLLDLLLFQQGDIDLSYSLLADGVGNLDFLHIQKHYEWLEQDTGSHSAVNRSVIISSISAGSRHYFIYSVPVSSNAADAPLMMISAIVSHDQLQKTLPENYHLILDGVKYSALKNNNQRNSSQTENGMNYYEKFDVIGGRKLWGEWAVGTRGSDNSYHFSVLSEIKKITIIEIVLLFLLMLVALIALEYGIWLRRSLIGESKKLKAQLIQSESEIDALRDNSHAISNDLLERQVDFYSVLDASTDGVIVCDDRGAIKNINQVVIKLFGYHEGEIIGKKIDFLFPELASQLEDFNDSFVECVAANSESLLVEVSAISKDNSFITVELYSKCVKVNNHVACSVIIRDVSTRAKNESEVRSAQKSFRTVIDNVAEGIIVSDSQGVIQIFNPAAERMFRWESAEIVGESVSVLMAEGDSEGHDSYLRRYLDLGKSGILGAGPREVVGVKKDGEIFNLEIAVNEMFNGNKRFFMAILRDVTEREIVEENVDTSYIELETMVDSHTDDLKNMNKELLKARDDALVAARSKSEFLAMMSHEIRTPINGVLGMLSLVRDTALNDVQKDYIETAYSSGEMLLALINDVLDLSKIDAGRMSLDLHDFDIYQLVEESAKITSKTLHDRDIEIICYISHEVPRYVNGDAGRLRQVLTNLMSNAVKFTEEGNVSVSLYVKNFSNDKYTLGFDVADTGIGIDEVDAAKIFEEFAQADNSERRNYGGTGLGLSICKQFVSMMDGELTVDSVPGGGSTFSFSACFATANKENSFLELNACRVLLLSDREIRCAAIGRQLEEWGCTIQKVNVKDVQCDYSSLSYQGDEVVILDLDRRQEEYLALVKSLVNVLLTNKLRILFVKDDESIHLFNITEELPGQVIEMNRQILPTVLFNSINTLLENATEDHSEDEDNSPENVKDEKSLDGVSVLVAEDNIVNQKVITTMLKKLGLEVGVVNNGQEALDALSDSDHGYRLVLMDCQMPEVDGYVATRKLRLIEKTDASTVRLPVIAMTAHALPGDREKCLDSGMDDYMTKPIKIDVVKKIIEAWL